MAIWNTTIYNAAIGVASVSPACGLASTDPRVGIIYQDANVLGGIKKVLFVQWNAATQNLASGDVINLAILPNGSRPVAVKMWWDTATATATLQTGIVGTAAYFSAAGISLTSASQDVNAFTATANFGVQFANATTVIATVAAAAITTGNFYWLIEYLTN